jgi:hypothetical protein
MTQLAGFFKFLPESARARRDIPKPTAADGASAGPGGARTQRAPIVTLWERLSTKPRLASAAAGFVTVAMGLVLAAPAPAQAATVGWSIRANVEPTVFSANDALRCEGGEGKCDSYQLLVANVGDEASSSSEPITLTDVLPPGITTLETPESGFDPEFLEWECTSGAGQTTVTCIFPGRVPAGRYAPHLNIRVKAPPASMSGTLRNEVSVSGGGAAGVVSSRQETAIGPQAPPFEIRNFVLEPTVAGGAADAGAGAHPWQVTTGFEIPLVFSPPGVEQAETFEPVENLKNAAVELPAGLIGDPQSASRCTEPQLRRSECPAASRIGAFAISGGAFGPGEFQYTDSTAGECCSAVYNIVPEGHYPAEFGFTFIEQTIFLYPSVVHTPSGYRLRVIAPGAPSVLKTSNVALTFFGDPGALNGSESEAAFLTNPADCWAGPLSTTIEIESWKNSPASAAAIAYPSVTGCSDLQFHPTLGLQPMAEGAGRERTPLGSADSPAGLDVDLQVPQTSGFEELATPPLKTATVRLPEGLVVNPSAAAGLEGCNAAGSQGINIGSTTIGAKGQDLGDPEATEAGEGHAGGNGSPYDDGFWHTASGHCPAASTMGTVEATTPLLPEPIKGQIFLGTPECAPCSSVDAEGGKLLKLYLEINDPKTGTILKLPGSVLANATTGRLTATFAENPQLPFSDLKLNFKTGPRAALTSPESCGTYSTSSSLEPWSAPETPTAISNSSFDISSGPQGCGAPPDKPKFEAGTTSTQAGAFAPFVLKLSREDGTQRLKALNVTLPPGLTGKLAGVQECSAAAITAAEGMGGKAEQASPSCPLASELGTVNVGAGSGPDPYYVQGHAYLAGPYKGAPLSMAIITPAVAGPFDLGTVVVRAPLFVDPYSAQITVKSDPLPQIVSGIPLDVRSIAVNISRNQFTLNPTSCNPMTLTAVVLATTSEANVANPFQVGNCTSLGFKPKVAISLKGKTKRTGHPALKAVVTYPEGGAYANIARAQVSLPGSEFLDQGNLNKVCKQAELNAGNCPAKSIYGKAKAWTPLLEKPLEGNVYLAVGFGYKLPALVAELNGQIRVLLKGKVDTDKAKGIRNTFEAVPDAPVSRFVLEMKGGKKYGLLENSQNICATPQKANATFTAQNGKVLTLKPVIANSCGKKSKKSSGKKK